MILFEPLDRRTTEPPTTPELGAELAAAGAGCVAIGAERVILIDRPAVLATADKAGIAIVGMPASGS